MIKTTKKEKPNVYLTKEVLDLLDVVKSLNPKASYNDTVYFLIDQYSKRLEELQIADVNKKVILNGETEDGT